MSSVVIDKNGCVISREQTIDITVPNIQTASQINLEDFGLFAEYGLSVEYSDSSHPSKYNTVNFSGSVGILTTDPLGKKIITVVTIKNMSIISNEEIIFLSEKNIYANKNDVISFDSTIGGSTNSVPVGYYRFRLYMAQESIDQDFSTHITGPLVTEAISYSYPDVRAFPSAPSGAMGVTGANGAIGNTGPAGFTGENGNIGPTGPTGYMGRMGNTGPTGSIGPIGPMGEQGSIGDTGPTGPTGNTGPIGETGAMGEQGPEGPQGEQGEQGPTGSVGTTGPNGPQGDQGPQGAQGNQGPQGIQGSKGPQGNIGPIGNIGATGPSGMNRDPSTNYKGTIVDFFGESVFGVQIGDTNISCSILGKGSSTANIFTIIPGNNISPVDINSRTGTVSFSGTVGANQYVNISSNSIQQIEFDLLTRFDIITSSVTDLSVLLGISLFESDSTNPILFNSISTTFFSLGTVNSSSPILAGKTYNGTFSSSTQIIPGKRYFICIYNQGNFENDTSLYYQGPVRAFTNASLILQY